MPLGITQADGFALSMIAILALSLSFVLAILVVMLRHSRKRNPEVDHLIEEVSDEKEGQAAGKHGADAKQLEPWEKPPDWWREGS